MSRRIVSRAGACGALMLAVSLSGCDDASPPPADSSSVSPTSSATDTQVDVGQLSTGQNPGIDAIVGRTLFHDGDAVDLDLPRDALYPMLMGSYDDRLILATSDGRAGTQFYGVDAAGSVVAIGEPHRTYNNLPQLVPETGHLLIPYNDRGTARETDTVLDATSGAVVGVYRDGRGQPALAKADQDVLDVWAGAAKAPSNPYRTSPDGSLAVVVRVAGDGRSTSVRVRSTDEDQATVSTFTFDAAVPEVAFESDDAVLVVAESGRGEDGLGRQVLVRCTTSGDCELASDPSGAVTLAGANLSAPG